MTIIPSVFWCFVIISLWRKWLCSFIQIHLSAIERIDQECLSWCSWEKWGKAISFLIYLALRLQMFVQRLLPSNTKDLSHILRIFGYTYQSQGKTWAWVYSLWACFFVYIPLGCGSGFFFFLPLHSSTHACKLFNYCCWMISAKDEVFQRCTPNVPKGWLEQEVMFSCDICLRTYFVQYHIWYFGIRRSCLFN